MGRGLRQLRFEGFFLGLGFRVWGAEVSKMGFPIVGVEFWDFRFKFSRGCQCCWFSVFDLPCFLLRVWAVSMAPFKVV